MGSLLKMKPATIAEAKARLERHIAEAHSRYERAVAEIETTAAKRGTGEPILPVRARNTLSNLLSVQSGEVNAFGRPLWRERPITPKAVSKFTAEEILGEPNSGYKTLRDIAAWLEFHGLNLKD